MVISSTLPPHRRVLCQVLACRWHEGLMCAPADQLLVARLHVSLRRPGDTLSRSSTNISRRRLPGPRNGLVGHRSWSPTNISQLHLHKLPERCRVVCASPSTADQLHLPGPRNGLVGHRSWSSTNISQLHLHKLPKRCRVCIVRSTNIAHNAATLPIKGCVASVSPDTPRMKKTVHVPVPFAPLSLTRLDYFPDPCFGPSTTTESPLSTQLVPHSGSGIQGNRTTRHRLPPGRTNS